MTNEERGQVKAIRERLSGGYSVSAPAGSDVMQLCDDVRLLLSLLDKQEGESDDGSAEWCDDCHGHTHRYDCPSQRQQIKTPLVDQIVNAVYRSMTQYDDQTWWLDELKAKARVRRLLNNPVSTSALK